MPNPYDPRGLINHAIGAARAGLNAYSWTEKQVVGALRQGLDALDDKDGAKAAEQDDTGAEPEAQGPDPASLSGKMTQLLGRALDQNTSGSQAELYHHLLDQLVADEARILGALSDGSSSPVVSVFGWMQSRTPGRAVLENASLIGRTANVALPHMVSQYVSHLRSLGLVEIGPEDPDLGTEYEVLLAETAVLAAIKSATRGPVPAKVEKFTLSLSPLGKALWQAATEGDAKG
ncbi:Abi-alpha family protein [Mycobacterium sp. 236(2023)]|uniref:Abi-alpha family protein n=1 Tax=Mycobacterium sp. 236(2023) TaxID=3038163 RepID=UPI002414F2D6|nr:Abi-alpha family protein [Mycobacterium sp. 236(2023)]MDG4667744.1 Abi-alpha family protein [Mycobacterium sp. 236(2023)]